MWFQLACCFFVISSVFEVSESFEEYSIFEDDDIYGKPVRTTNDTQYSESMIFPGTKWCGPGDIATNFNDLGSYRETDKCCREHDNCKDLILPKKSRHGLQNPDRYTRLQCDCEQKFINCLKKANDLISWTIGKLYYNARNTCYKMDYPVIECADYQQGFITRRRRCIKYKMNKNRTKEWQWFDMPFFIE